MKVQTKIYSLDFKTAWDKVRHKLGTDYQLVECVEDVDPKCFYMLLTKHGTPYDDTPEDEKRAMVVTKAQFIRFVIDRAMVLYKRRPTKFKYFKLCNEGKFPKVICYET